MKLTKLQLKQLIKEELANLQDNTLAENVEVDFSNPVGNLVYDKALRLIKVYNDDPPEANMFYVPVDAFLEMAAALRKAESTEQELEEGLLNIFKKKDPSRYKLGAQEYSPEQLAARTAGELKPNDQKALDTSYMLINSFLQDSQDTNNQVERYAALEKLMRDLSTEMILRPERKKE